MFRRAVLPLLHRSVQQRCLSASVVTAGDEVLLTRSEDNRFATLTINRPEVHNAINPAVMDGVTSYLNDIRDDTDLRAVFLRGAGPTFCAGGDLKHMRSTADFTFEENEADAMRLSAVFDTINYFPKPVVGLVGGNTFGGGIGVISACDMAFSVQSAKFTLSEVKLGVIPATISPYVVARMGANHCRRYFLTAEMFGAEEAERVGLLSGVVEDAEALDAMEERLKVHFGRAAPGAVARSKELIFGVAQRPVDLETRKWTATILAEVRESEEGQEGMTAFIEKRKAAWNQQ